MRDLLLTYYGDDFTGSTDVMEALCLNGIPAILFLDPPEPGVLERECAGFRAVGVAGVSRSLSPAEMERELYPKFEALKKLGAPLFHYKTCSTFDSSPEVGSIGRATDIGWEVFRPAWVPMVIGAPVLRRYVVFGNLFATVGNETYRLDRHPTMSRHPVTPMNESDIRLHLEKQTGKRIALFDLLQLNQPDDLEERFRRFLDTAGPEIVLFDTLHEADLPRIGQLIWEHCRNGKQTFLVGSSGMEYALAAWWRKSGLAKEPETPVSPGPSEPLVVVSGSAAPATAEQISWALEHGFEGIRLDAARLIDPSEAETEQERAFSRAVDFLTEGKSVVLYTVTGPDDPALEATRARGTELGVSSVGHGLGEQQGILLRRILEKTDLKRACVAGGDTSGYAAKQLGIYALEMLVPIAPGSPLCRARSHNRRFHGLEISLKGGQVGKPDYFGCILQGHANG